MGLGLGLTLSLSPKPNPNPNPNPNLTCRSLASRAALCSGSSSCISTEASCAAAARAWELANRRSADGAGGADDGADDGDAADAACSGLGLG